MPSCQAGIRPLVPASGHGGHSPNRVIPDNQASPFVRCHYLKGDVHEPIRDISSLGRLRIAGVCP